jgi:hypothetical protein
VAAFVVMGGALALGGSTPWKDKPYNQWNEKDITLILQNSPWAKMVPNVGGTMHQLGNTNLDGSGGVMDGGTGVGGAGSGNGRGGGGGGFSAILPAEHDSPLVEPRAPKTYWVVWWSARTVREAAARYAMLGGTATEEQMKQQAANTTGDYEVMIRGLNMSVFDERPEQSFMDKAFLQLKSSKEKIMPTKVEYLKTQEGHVSAAIFHFAMKNASGERILSPADKHVDFYCHVADGTIRTWFEPDNMVDNQGEDL